MRVLKQTKLKPRKPGVFVRLQKTIEKQGPRHDYLKSSKTVNRFFVGERSLELSESKANLGEYQRGQNELHGNVSPKMRLSQEYSI